MAANPEDIVQRHTWKDYLEREGRWELIDGVFYDMAPAPHPRHQRLVVRIWDELDEHLDCNDCEVYIAPIDWRIDDHTVVQPDVAIFCEPPERPYFSRTPPLIVEVLSPATAYKDLEIKRKLYERCGVKFYVIVEPADLFADIFECVRGQYQFRLKALHDHRFEFDLGGCGTRIDFRHVFDPPPTG